MLMRTCEVLELLAGFWEAGDPEPECRNPGAVLVWVYLS